MRINVPFNREPTNILQRDGTLYLQKFNKFGHPKLKRNRIKLELDLPRELIQNIIVETIFQQLFCRRIPEASLLISSQKYYVDFFYRYFFGSTSASTFLKYFRLNRTLFLLSTVYEEILLYPIDSDIPEFYLIDLQINPDSPYYNPWNFVEQLSPFENFVDMNLLLTQKPIIENYKNFEIFKTGNLFGDIIYATGTWENEPILNYNVKDFKSPIISFTITQGKHTVFVEPEFTRLYHWAGFKKLCNIVFGCHTGIYFTKEQEETDFNFYSLELFEIQV